MPDHIKNRRRIHLSLIRLVGIIVPRRLRGNWRQEWEAELRHREMMLADWERLNFRSRLDLLRRSCGAFADALVLQPRRLEDEMFQDLRYGIRMLWKEPGFTAIVVLTLAIGIGANAALFSVVNSVLLNPLPFPEPDRLVTLHQSKPNFETGAIPYPNFRDWQKQNQTFSAMAISRPFGFSLVGPRETERINARLVTADYFSVLGIEPLMGRTFSPGEDEPGVEPVVVISEALWRDKMGSPADVLQRSITLDSRSYAVVGVIPATFNLVRGVDAYVPIGQWNSPALKSRAAALGLHGIGRLKPGVTVAQAEADLDRIMEDLAAAYPETNKGNGATLVALRERVVGEIEPILLMLLGAVAFVLLISCVNVSNLLLARSTGRTRELAIRSALGAGQWRLVRQLLTESTLLAFTGGGLGLILAGWGTQAALSALPRALPRADEVKLDWRVLLFTISISLLTGVLSGLVPAFKKSNWRLSETLKEGGRGASPGRARAQGLFVAVEMALALVLLIGAGLMIRSLAALWKVDPGFRPQNVLTFGLNLSPSLRAASPEKNRTALRELSDQINAIKGVRSASFSAGAVPLQDEDDLFFWIDGKPKPASQSEMSMALIYRVEPGYLAAMDIPLKHGRFFTDQDDERSRRVAVIDEVFAQKHFGGEDPIGRRIRFDGDREPLEVVGVVGHVKQWSIDADETQSLQAQLYEPFRQLTGSNGGARVIARFDSASGNAGPVIESIRRVVQGYDSQNVVFRPELMTDVIAGSFADRRFSMILLVAFAGVALLLASVGIYGVISYLVGQRTHELGIRVALGATRGDVMRLVLSHGMKMALAGVAIGLMAAYLLTRFIEKMLFGVDPADPATFAVIAGVLTITALLACYVPARRATTIDPLTALREE